jgi:hypothetical protein
MPLPLRRESQALRYWGRICTQADDRINKKLMMHYITSRKHKQKLQALNKTWFHTMYTMIEDNYPKLEAGLQGKIISPEEQKDPHMAPDQKKNYARLHWYKLVEEVIQEEGQKWLQKNLEIKSSLRYYAMFKKEISMDNYLYDTNRLGVDIKLQLRAGVYRLAARDFLLNPLNSNGHCSCCCDGEVETRAHFILHCPVHDATRADIIRTIKMKLIPLEDGTLMTSSFLTWMRAIRWGPRPSDKETEDAQMCFILGAPPPTEVTDELRTHFQGDRWTDGYRY